MPRIDNKTFLVIERDDPIYRPWMEGTTKAQRALVTKIVKKVCKCEREWAHFLLENVNVSSEDTLGLNIIDAHTASGAEGVLRLLYDKTHINPRVQSHGRP
ncbi:hypothetical protein CBS101457_000222 [Exobasidium rhododendri]|nr:hypothetical protein CBS101457_000222 [Exobasidium rhododendri]